MSEAKKDTQNEVELQENTIQPQKIPEKDPETVDDAHEVEKEGLIIGARMTDSTLDETHDVKSNIIYSISSDCFLTFLQESTDFLNDPNVMYKYSRASNRPIYFGKYIPLLQDKYGIPKFLIGPDCNFFR